MTIHIYKITKENFKTEKVEDVQRVVTRNTDFCLSKPFGSEKIVFFNIVYICPVFFLYILNAQRNKYGLSLQPC